MKAVTVVVIGPLGTVYQANLIKMDYTQYVDCANKKLNLLTT